MKAYHLLLAAGIAFTACHKDTPKNDPVDKFSVKLKDYSEGGLPSPYYHFDYNDSGFVTHVSFASNLIDYTIFYTGTKIARMEASPPNSEVLQYEYGNGQVKSVNIVNKQGVIYRKCTVTVNGSNQLQKLFYELLVNGSFVPEQYQQFSYHADGNLNELTQHYYALGPQQELTFTDKYDDYDSKINTDAFTLLQPTQMQHLVLLPSFTIQKNNARRVVRTGDGVNYEVDYSYTYDAGGRPLERTGLLLFTKGPDKGLHFQLLSAYSYYD